MLHLESILAGLPPNPRPQPYQAHIAPHQRNHEGTGQIVGPGSTNEAQPAHAQVCDGYVHDQCDGADARLGDCDPLRQHDAICGSAIAECKAEIGDSLEICVTGVSCEVSASESARLALLACKLNQNVKQISKEPA